MWKKIGVKKICCVLLKPAKLALQYGDCQRLKLLHHIVSKNYKMLMLLYASFWIFNFFLTCLECSYGALLAKCRFSTEKQSKFQWAESHGSAILLVHLSCSRVSTENHMAYPSRLTHPDSFKWLQGKWHESWDQSCGHSTSCHRPIVWTNDLQHVMHVSAMSDKSTSTAIWASGPVAPLWFDPQAWGQEQIMTKSVSQVSQYQKVKTWEERSA